MRRRLLAVTCFIFSFTCLSAQNADINVLKEINPARPTSGFWKFTSGATYFISAGVPASVLIAGIVQHDHELKQQSYEIFGSLVAELIISESIKSAVNRQRPAEKYPAAIAPYRNVTGRSFPSGHASLAFATAASLSLQCKLWYVTVPAYAWATTVAYSRMYLGVHYPSDVLAGAAIGIGSAYLSNWLNKKIHHSKSHQRATSVE